MSSGHRKSAAVIVKRKLSGDIWDRILELQDRRLVHSPLGRPRNAICYNSTYSVENCPYSEIGCIQAKCWELVLQVTIMMSDLPTIALYVLD
jgi:hypothetical protein